MGQMSSQITRRGLDGEASPDLRTDAGRLPGPAVYGAPHGARLGQDAAVPGPEQFGKAFDPNEDGASHPCPGDDPVAQEGRLLIVDLVTHHYPQQFRLVCGGRGSRPMRHRSLLHPAKGGNVVDVAELVDIYRLYRYGRVKRFPRLAP